jgi:hypothetical protein
MAAGYSPPVAPAAIVAPRPVMVPRAAVLVAGFREALWLSPDGRAWRRVNLPG